MQATVVVSCYKQEKYIEACLDSIIEQEVDFGFNIIVADDCSPDLTQSILKAYVVRNPQKKIELILRDKNIGAAKNYLDVHNKATGDIVFHFDGDDLMLPGKLQRQFDEFRRDESINLVLHRAVFFSDDGSYMAQTGAYATQSEKLKYFTAEDLALWGTIAVHSSYAYRRQSRKKRDIDREFMEWFFAMDSLLPTGAAVYINEVLVKYRCNLAGDAYSSSLNGRAKAYKIYFRDVSHYFDNFPQLQKKLYANYLFTSLSMYKARCGFPLGNFIFLIKNVFNLRLFLLLDVFRIRKLVSPEKRIR